MSTQPRGNLIRLTLSSSLRSCPESLLETRCQACLSPALCGDAVGALHLAHRALWRTSVRSLFASVYLNITYGSIFTASQPPSDAAAQSSVPATQKEVDLSEAIVTVTSNAQVYSPSASASLATHSQQALGTQIIPRSPARRALLLPHVAIPVELERQRYNLVRK